jgi:hypothetical protein
MNERIHYVCYDIWPNPFVVVQSRDGSAEAINYGFISRMTFSRDRGITLTHGRHRLIVKGQRLFELFTALAAGNVAAIRAVDPERVKVPDNDVLVTSARRIKVPLEQQYDIGDQPPSP